MGTFPEAESRLYESIYICKRCQSKTRVPINKILAEKGVCRKCKNKALRPVRKKSKK